MCRGNATVVKVHILNNITETQVKQAKFFVYGYLFDKEKFYVGMTNDLVTRYDEHYRGAYNSSDRGCNYDVKSAFKANEPKVYLIGVAETKEECQNLEAQAIYFYSKGNLNHRQETHKITDKKYYFNRSVHMSIEFTAKKNKDKSQMNQYKAKDREKLLCKIVGTPQRKRVQCIEGKHKGLFVSCSKKEREIHEVGAKVYIRATINSAGNQLIAPVSDKFIPAE
ncbi:putative GIY-YIG superfamily endonuclease [Aeromonas hydrophila]|uniref:GIY-YIG nuclease family protein n=1 Tax=Aeromonas TaxID=642 RepID=UPI000E201949|nr:MULTISPECIES: GIY-YIG nuclease family protein [Aeromonas]MCS3766728.1 putative GIY-YIG superfamily endonuclease [Aeromonas hydrophila]MCS3793308.1 putative GIY-YIG superfamily endonuclease [Aeromonas hydrophila]HAU4894890.1 hypothetical protein [Aeromonas hydrophila]HAU4976064.1 hypothetical protein [Aeromonas hydrophila]HAU4985078.1 hypothetical protein [Aeromonas hydrophila]